ncbi:MAG: adenylyltransferase/cytidyltransferase family protein [Candidatus Acidiferrales bacterium]
MGLVVSQSDLILQRRDWKRNAQRVVFVAGCFDLLHPGHIRLLEQARSRGQILVVGVESDASVRARKGSGRPVAPAAERAEILAALDAVNAAVIWEGSGLTALVIALAPDLIVAGADPTEPVLDQLKASGIEIVRIPLEPGYSTGLLLDRIAQSGA